MLLPPMEIPVTVNDVEWQQGNSHQDAAMSLAGDKTPYKRVTSGGIPVVCVKYKPDI